MDTHRIPGSRFVCYLQDHDQIGNRAQGDRLSASVRPGLLACGAAIVRTVVAQRGTHFCPRCQR